MGLSSLSTGLERWHFYGLATRFVCSLCVPCCLAQSLFIAFDMEIGTYGLLLLGVRLRASEDFPDTRL